MPSPRRLLLALLPLPAATVPAAARTCDEDDLALIELLGGEWDEWADPGAAELLDEAWLFELAAAAGCEWEATPGGAAEALERLRFRDAPAPGDLGAADPWARFRPWWRALLPRIELRWWSRIEDEAIGERTVQGRPAAFELWLLWSFAGGP
ncbi:MAG: hypothetical protein GYA57_21980 [Myxococcales bacterium]|nr:hypothetical protein [Myxococcales bacterium]